jgi:acetyltransferase-like isoleucine patch superfamily enzyme
MSAIARFYRNWHYGRQFAKKGKRFRFTGQFMDISGHVEIGDNCRFRNNTVLRTKNEGKIIFGDRSGTSYNVIIESTALVQIGGGTAIGENTVIRDTNHLLHGTDEGWRLTPLLAEPIIIGDATLVGSGVYIGPGVTIGDGAVIAHGSILTKGVGEFEIWGGAPARFISHRTKNVPDSVLKRNVELVKMYGVKKDRYGFEAARENASETAPEDESP